VDDLASATEKKKKKGDGGLEPPNQAKIRLIARQDTEGHLRLELAGRGVELHEVLGSEDRR
jgi:hypothetical protein